MFGDGISYKDVEFTLSGDDMILTFGYDSNLAEEQRDSIVITNFEESGFEIESLEFSSGESYSIIELIEKNLNHAPTTIFKESSYTLSDVSQQTGIILAKDTDGDSLIYNITTSPENGTININNYGIWTYTSNDKYIGADSVIVTIDDGNGLSTTKTLNFEVVVTNIDPVVIESESNIVLQDVREYNGDIEATDADILNYTVSTDTQHGTLNIDKNGEWIYNAENRYIGKDLAIITIDDSNGGSVTKTLNFNTKVSNPTIDIISFKLQEDNSTTNKINISNPVGGAITYEVLTTTINGDFTVDENGRYTYNPSKDYNGTDAVTIKVTNEYDLSTISTLIFEIEALNDIPVVENESESLILANISNIDGKVKATDIDSDTLNYRVETDAKNGVVTVDDNGNWHYKADDSFNGNDSATILVDDGNGGSVVKTLNFNIYDDKDLVVDDSSIIDTQITLDNGIFTGSGDDIININGNQNGSIFTGEGNDIINIISNSNSVNTNLPHDDLNSDIITGNNDDIINIGGNQNAIVATYGGNDSVNIENNNNGGVHTGDQQF